MVEFDFDLKSVFPEEIVKISSRDFKECNYAEPAVQHKISNLKTIIDHMGRLSAVAQGLKAPITTAEKIQVSDNEKLYLMASLNDKEKKQSVVGLLKVGKRDLYLYDELKQQRKVRQVPCILDFYVFELCQRAGYGKRLFEKMLHEENLKPNQCSIDIPSEKFTGFLKKHYGLEKTIPQGYRFVLYKGFFDHQRESTFNEKPSTSNSSRQGYQFAHQENRAGSINYKPQQSSLSAEHFGANLDVFGYNTRCNQKLSKHCVTEQHPCYNVEVMQTPNK